MDSRNSILPMFFSLVAASAVAFGVVVVTQKPTIVNQVTTPPPTPSGESPIPADRLGAIPGSDIEGKYFSVGGVEMAYVKQSWIATTTRVCIIKNPFNATSSLVRFTAKNTNTVAHANTFDVSTSTTFDDFATTSTSFINNHSIPASQFTVINWNAGLKTSTTGPSAERLLGGKCTKSGSCNFLLDSNEFVRLVRNATGTAGTDDYQGVCNATFQKI